MSDDKTKPDLTRIEDLSEFLHQEDPETDALLQDHEEQESDEVQLPSIDDLESDDLEEANNFPDLPSEEDDTLEELQSNFEAHESFDEQGEFDEEAQVSDFDEQTQPSEFEFEDENLPNIEDEVNLEDDEEQEIDEEEDFFNDEDDTFDDDNQYQQEQNEELEEHLEEEILPEESDAQEDITPTEQKGYEEEIIEETIGPVVQAPTIQREKFEDVRTFSENISYGNVQTGGNPPFSIVLKKIRNQDDLEYILEILQDHNLINDQNESVMRNSLEHGSLLLSQLSEYSAIYLAHKLRRFNLEIMVGLSEEIHPSKSYENEEKGQISRKNLNQNKILQEDLKEDDITAEEILVTTSPYLEGLQIRKYLDVVTTTQIVGAEDIREEEEEEEEEEENAEVQENQLYQALKSRLRHIAHQIGANALVGINYQIQTTGDDTQTITASANAVIVTDIPRER